MKAHAAFPALALLLLMADAAAGALPRPQRPFVASPGVLHVEGQMEAGRMLRWVRPVYPAAAMKARVQGVVVFDALIDVKGDVERLKYVSGPVVLVRSARKAARRWEYTPVLFNGVVMKVETTIQVNFALPRAHRPTAEFSGKATALQRHQPAKPRSEFRVTPGRLLHMVRPTYPPEAEHEGIEGKVVLKVFVGKDGRVIELQYISGPMPLVEAAMDAVRQWQYRPARLNGSPVQAPTLITLIFRLGHEVGVQVSDVFS